MSRNNDLFGNWIKTPISFRILTVSKKNTGFGLGKQFIEGIRDHPREATTPKQFKGQILRIFVIQKFIGNLKMISRTGQSIDQINGST